MQTAQQVKLAAGPAAVPLESAAALSMISQAADGQGPRSTAWRASSDHTRFLRENARGQRFPEVWLRHSLSSTKPLHSHTTCY